MQKRLIRALLRVVQSPQTTFPASEALLEFHRDYALGLLKGRTAISFTAAQKTEIYALLLADAGIDAHQVRAEDWDQATRAEALDLGVDEKLARGPVKRNRISVKALRGCALRLNGQRIELFPKAHLDVAWDALYSIGHEVVLLVENYECFNDLDKIAGMDSLASELGAEPLVIYRGDPHESRLDNVTQFLARKALPVVLFYDYDPSSLMEAARLQNAVGMLIPADIEATLTRLGNAELYRRQISSAFQELAGDQRRPIARLYHLLQIARKGLAQEKLIGSSITVTYQSF